MKSSSSSLSILNPPVEVLPEREVGENGLRRMTRGSEFRFKHTFLHLSTSSSRPRCSSSSMRASNPSTAAQQASTLTEGDSHVQEPDKLNSVGDMSTTAPGQDEVMTDDMKLAISALGLLRNEGTVGGGGEPSNSAPHQPHLSSSSAAAAGPSYHSAHQYRSTSTASTSTASETWGTSSSTFLQSGSETGTGTSSPLTTTSIAPSDGEGVDYFKRGQAEQEGGEDVEGVEGDARFIERVSQLPLVSGGLEWYERSKANSRVVKVSSLPTTSDHAFLCSAS